LKAKAQTLNDWRIALNVHRARGYICFTAFQWHLELKERSLVPW